jgi:hypothetical protein
MNSVIPRNVQWKGKSLEISSPATFADWSLSRKLQPSVRASKFCHESASVKLNTLTYFIANAILRCHSGIGIPRGQRSTYCQSCLGLSWSSHCPQSGAINRKSNHATVLHLCNELFRIRGTDSKSRNVGCMTNVREDVKVRRSRLLRAYRFVKARHKSFGSTR